MNTTNTGIPEIIIHRGSNVIGGNCIEIIFNSRSIILDLGMPLMTPDGLAIDSKATENPSIANGILPNLESLYKNDDRIIGVILSHPHMDHFGLMNHIDPAIPIYMGEDCFNILSASNVFWSKEMKVDKMLSHSKTFKNKNSFQIGDFVITPYSIDHSAFGAYCILIDVGGKRIFYSGDFRGHGAIKHTFENLLKNPPKDIDCLLMEGTSMRSSQKGHFDSEEKVFEEFKRLLSEQSNLTFVTQAGSNITRLVQLFRACRTTKKTLVIDLYQYHLLKVLSKENPKLPPFDNDRTIRIYFNRGHVGKLSDFDKELLSAYQERRIGIDEIARNRDKMVLRFAQYMFDEVASDLNARGMLLDGSFYIFSMWEGYLKNQDGFQKFIEEYKLMLVSVHTSGHAYVSDLQRFVKALNPGYLVPIHTLLPEKYPEMFDCEIKLIGDNERKMV
jgi:ribonuclease J